MKKIILISVVCTLLGGAAIFGVLVLLTNMGGPEIQPPPAPEPVSLQPSEPPPEPPAQPKRRRRRQAGEPATVTSSPGLAPPVPVPAAETSEVSARRRRIAERQEKGPAPRHDDPQLKRKVERFRNITEENFDEIKAELDLLGERAKAGNDDALRTLMAVADANVCMGTDAVKMLAATGKPEVGEFMLRLARKPDERMSVAAVKGLPGVLDEKRALKELDLLLMDAYGVPHRDDLRAACTAALTQIASEACIPLAARELSGLDVHRELEYGSLLVALVKAIGSQRGIATLEKYAQRLAKARPKDKLRAKYFSTKQDEVRQAVDALLAPPPPR